jgi:hypothetical protein
VRKKKKNSLKNWISNLIKKKSQIDHNHPEIELMHVCFFYMVILQIKFSMLPNAIFEV